MLTEHGRRVNLHDPLFSDHQDKAICMQYAQRSDSKLITLAIDRYMNSFTAQFPQLLFRFLIVYVWTVARRGHLGIFGHRRTFTTVGEVATVVLPFKVRRHHCPHRSGSTLLDALERRLIRVH